LVEHFLKKYAAELKSRARGVSGEAMRTLENLRWKGNVRELENTIERAIIMCGDEETLRPEHLSQAPPESPGLLSGLPMDGPLEDAARAALKAVETERIRKALRESSGNKTRAAEQLRVSYKTLLNKVKEYGIE
jgi:two-component system response regulator AtoC